MSFLKWSLFLSVIHDPLLRLNVVVMVTGSLCKKKKKCVCVWTQLLDTAEIAEWLDCEGLSPLIPLINPKTQKQVICQDTGHNKPVHIHSQYTCTVNAYICIHYRHRDGEHKTQTPMIAVWVLMPLL